MFSSRTDDFCSGPFQYPITSPFLDPQSTLDYSSCSPGFAYCFHCGIYHRGVCPRIKSVEYYPNGMIKRVEYHESMNELSKGTITYKVGF